MGTSWGDGEGRTEGGESQHGAHGGGEPLDTARLDLDDADERLPWLESEDDEYEYEGAGTARVLGLLVFGLVALAVIVGGIWWATHRDSSSGQVAEGGIIAAPTQPYKEAPRNPGGKTFAGTGDSSFAVSEGQSRPARLGQAEETPKAAAEVVQKPAEQGTPAATAVPAPDAGRVGVQVGAFSTQASAEAAWVRYEQQHEALSGLHHRVVEGRADIGTVYRLQALADDAAAAHALCGKLKSAGLACQVKN